ncbi:MAG: NUDIX hydrolase [Acetobacteraceae bacterium]|nr:NUDIX hydrolase [Acetobacteraceae bacterium]
MAKEAVARPAATIVLMRDGPAGLEVFMVVRHHAIDFASGALVFPGGRVDENDFALAANPALCPNPNGIETEAMAFRLAAIRETFEECGVLLARPGHALALVDGASLRAVEASHRAPLAEGRISFDTVLTAHGLLPATDLLTHFAHWITPANQPKRYNTHFFLAEAPAEHLAVHDGHESIDSMWIAPRQVLTDTAAGRFKLVFATQMNLMKLASHGTMAEAIAATRAANVVTVLPEVSMIDGTRRLLRIPLEAGYGAAEFMVDNPPAS